MGGLRVDLNSDRDDYLNSQREPKPLDLTDMNDAMKTQNLIIVDTKLSKTQKLAENKTLYPVQ